MPDFVTQFLAQAGAVGVMGLVCAYIFKLYVAHLEAEIAYLRSQNAGLEQRIIDLEAKAKV
jgi:hypothetical protein